MSKKLSPYAKKDNFWSKLRVEKKLTLREVGELIGEDEKRTGFYFSGFIIPDDGKIRALCELFDVDFKKGQLEFQHAHRQYRAEHGKSAVYSSKPKKKGQIDNVEDVLNALYGVLSCNEFVAIYDAIKGDADDTVNPLKILYHKIDDYETFYKIVRIIKGTGDGVI